MNDLSIKSKWRNESFSIIAGRKEHGGLRSQGLEAVGKFVVSLDFELYWGIHGLVDLPAYRKNILGARVAIPAILKLFMEFEIHATWAVVGFLFFDKLEDLRAALPARRPTYRDSRINNYNHLAEIGEVEFSSGIYSAGGLIDQIRAGKLQEIGTHTFSHYYCLEAGQDDVCFRDDIAAAHRVAASRGIQNTSIIFPRNQVNPDYLAICEEAGILAFRGNPMTYIDMATDNSGQTPSRRALRLLDSYLPVFPGSLVGWKRSGGPSSPVNIPATRFLRPFSRKLRLLEPMKLSRIKAEMSRAARKRGGYHLWWHPHNFGVCLDENLRNLRHILEHFRGLRSTYGMTSLTMAEAAKLCRH